MQLRPASEVMRLGRMGAAFPTRLSFMRSLVRRMAREKWRFSKQLFDVDAQGFGTTVLSVDTPERRYSLLVFTHDLPPEKRTDRVIAEAWDATFNLIDGAPDKADIERLRANTPLQEGGRYSQKELVLARANKSIRLFEHVLAALAAGRQPDMSLVGSVGYLMRTTAVYGNGKFGIADRACIADRPEAEGAFQIEMLAVYLFRWFTIELAQHIARMRGGDRAVALDPAIARYLGIGNATGLGMAPFLVRHPGLIDRWVTARETALARVRRLERATPATISAFLAALTGAERHVGEWMVEDGLQMDRIRRLREDLARIRPEAEATLPDAAQPWDRLYEFAARACSVEGQELLLSLMLEPHGELIDELADGLAADERLSLDAAMTCGVLRALIRDRYGWALALDFADKGQNAKFWYYSEEKLEPRLGNRHCEEGAEREMPLAVARDVAALDRALAEVEEDCATGAFLGRHPECLQAVRRVQLNAARPYSEIRDNLIGEGMRPIDILRFKLAFFGASRFDPKSDLWTRISMYQGAPQPGELNPATVDGWPLSARPDLAA